MKKKTMMKTKSSAKSSGKKSSRKGGEQGWEMTAKDEKVLDRAWEKVSGGGKKGGSRVAGKKK